MKRIVPFLLVLTLFLLPGCLNIEMGIQLNRDLSGTADMDFNIDMEAMAYVSAAMGKAFSGEEGPPTAEEIEEARKSLLEETQAEEPVDIEQMKMEAAEDLPEGVELVDVTYQSEGLKTAYGLKLKFDHLDRLNELDLSSDEGASSEEGSTSALEEPFSGLRLLDEGDVWLLTTPPLDPVADAESQAEGAPGMEGMEEMIAKVFEGLRIAFTVTVPTEVVAHNATRVEGNKLIWEWTYATLEAMRDKPEEAAMFVRFKK